MAVHLLCETSLRVDDMNKGFNLTKKQTVCQNITCYILDGCENFKKAIMFWDAQDSSVKKFTPPLEFGEGKRSMNIYLIIYLFLHLIELQHGKIKQHPKEQKHILKSWFGTTRLLSAKVCTPSPWCLNGNMESEFQLQNLFVKT